MFHGDAKEILTTVKLDPNSCKHSQAKPNLQPSSKPLLSKYWQEQPDLIRDAVEDALEEIALARAIEAGMDFEDRKPRRSFRVAEGRVVIVEFKGSFLKDLKKIKDAIMLSRVC